VQAARGGCLQASAVGKGGRFLRRNLPTAAASAPHAAYKKLLLVLVIVAPPGAGSQPVEGGKLWRLRTEERAREFSWESTRRACGRPARACRRESGAVFRCAAQRGHVAAPPAAVAQPRTHNHDPCRYHVALTVTQPVSSRT